MLIITRLLFVRVQNTKKLCILLINEQCLYLLFDDSFPENAAWKL